MKMNLIWVKRQVHWHRLVLIAAALSCWTQPGHAETLSANGTIAGLANAGPQAFTLRAFVHDQGQDVLAGCEESFVYLNDTDPEYASKASLVLDLYLGAGRVSLTYDREGSGWCRLLSISPI